MRVLAGVQRTEGWLGMSESICTLSQPRDERLNSRAIWRWCLTSCAKFY
ncbi:hypothetical protein D918_05187 [Trichuris suis]|nr:hypothetical protein D918_05187 [Trichuris suis]